MPTTTHYHSWPLERTLPEACPLGTKPTASRRIATFSSRGCHFEPVWQARKLPQRVVWFGSTQHAPEEFLRFIKPEYRDLPFLVLANFEISGDLKALLSRVVALCTEGEPGHAWESARISQLLTLQDECLDAFAMCAAESHRREKAE